MSAWRPSFVPRAPGFPLETIHVGALNRVSLTRKLRTLAELPRSVWQARVLLRKHQPSAVLSLGGYASGPLALAAARPGYPRHRHGAERLPRPCQLTRLPLGSPRPAGF
ncbi:MAG: glycosyltransferase [Bryobacterales bacterium]